MADDLANFQTTPVAAPTEYRKFALRDLYMCCTYDGPSANQAVVVKPRGGFGATAIHNWPIYDGPCPGARLVARARGLHVDTGAGFWYNTFSFVFENGRLKGSTLQAMGMAPEVDDEYSIVGGSGEFAMASGVVNIVVYRREGNTDIDRLTIKGFSPVMKESPTSGSSTVQSIVTKIGPWGGTGGSGADVSEPPHRLETVTIRSGIVVDSISYSYIDQAGRKHHAGPWGGKGGNATTIHLAAPEFIKEVSGTTGAFGVHTVVTSIKFVSNLKTYGPFGQANGTSFSVPVQGDNGVVGFFGRARMYVDAFGVYVRP